MRNQRDLFQILLKNSNLIKFHWNSPKYIKTGQLFSSTVYCGLLNQNSIFKGSDDKIPVSRPPGQKLNTKLTRSTIKHGVRKGVMFWRCFSSVSGLGHLYYITGILDQHAYRKNNWRSDDPFCRRQYAFTNDLSRR